MKFEICPAQRTDLPDILRLVKELANYEKAPLEVTSTISMYNEAFDDNLFFVDIVKIQDQIIGFTLYYPTFSTWKGKMMYLEDFYLQETYRNQGIGSALFDRFLLKAKEEGCILTKWQVLDWNQNAIDFYEHRGARIQKGWWNGLIDL